MNCSKHNGKPAVAQCAECGAGVCADCASKTNFLKEDYGVLCVDCCKSKMNTIADFYKQDKGKRTKRIVISVITYFFGLIAFLAFFLRGEVAMLFVGIVLCGFYTGLTWRDVAQKSHDEDELKNGITYVVTDDGIKREDGFLMKLIFFIIGTVIGVILTPIRIILDAVGISKDKKYIKEINSDISCL